MTNGRVKSVGRVKVFEGISSDEPDLLACEEPLEIRLGYTLSNVRHQKSISVTMRTPGADFELAMGFLLSESIITSFEEVENIKYCHDGDSVVNENIVRVELTENVTPDIGKLQRHFYTSSSCGVCGKSSIEAVSVLSVPLEDSDFSVHVEAIQQAPQKLRESQLVFKHTGGLHAAGLFNEAGDLLLLREDVGRHNALDKVIGQCLLQGSLPLSESFLLLSGRISFELVQKAIMAGISIVAAVGAPSSLAVELADQFNVTLIGFLKSDSCNIYSGEHRILVQ